MKAISSRVSHPSHPGRGHGSLTCHMTQFERSDWLRSENFINIMIKYNIHTDLNREAYRDNDCQNKERNHINRLVKERLNSSALAMELRLSCANPSIRYMCFGFQFGYFGRKKESLNTENIFMCNFIKYTSGNIYCSVGYRRNTVQNNIIFHTQLLHVTEHKSEFLFKKIPHSSPSRVSYRVSIVRIRGELTVVRHRILRG